MEVERHNRFVLAVDLGTSGCKCALVGLDGVVRRWAFRPVQLHIVDQVGAEQSPDDWWSAFIGAAREVIENLPEVGGEIAAICCSCQGECTVAVDRTGKPLHPALLWIDMRAADAIRRRAGNRMLAVAGYDPLKLWRWIRRAGGAPALSGKDPAGHMAFIQEAWPEIYDRTYKFLNALDYMNLRLTGRFVATVDSILTSWVTDNRDPGNIHYDRKLVAQSGIDLEKLPEIVRCTDVLGPLCPSAAQELGLPQDTLVVAGRRRQFRGGHRVGRSSGWRGPSLYRHIVMDRSACRIQEDRCLCADCLCALRYQRPLSCIRCPILGRFQSFFPVRQHSFPSGRIRSGAAFRCLFNSGKNSSVRSAGSSRLALYAMDFRGALSGR